MAFDPTLGFHYASPAQQQQQQRIGSHPADRSNMDAQGRTILATPSKHPRLICLDALRGVAIMAMIVSKDSSESGPPSGPSGGYVFRGALAPSPWQGINFADFVSPLFMFIVGATLPLSSTARCISSSASSSTPAFLRRRIQWAASRRVVWRSLQLFALGLVLEGPGPGGLPNHIDLEHLRVPGTLQQIAFVYAVTALVHIWIPQRTVTENDDDDDGGEVEQEQQQQQQQAPRSAAATATTTGGSRSSSATASTASALAAAAASSSNYNSNSNSNGLGSSGNDGGRVGGPDSAENSLGSSSGPSRTTSARPSLLARTRCFMLRTYAWHFCFALLVLAVYLSLLLGVSVPGCGSGGGVFSPGCNSGRWLDQQLFGSAHMDHRVPSNLMRLPECSACSPAFCPLPSSSTPPAEWCSQPFEPLGVLATIGGSLLISFGGLMFGNVLVHVSSHRVRLRVWVQMGLFLALPLGLLGHLAGAVPATPQIGTTSFALITLGTAGVGLAALYALLEAPKQMWREKTKRVFHPVICMVSCAPPRTTNSQAFFSPHHHAHDRFFCLFCFACALSLAVAAARWFVV
jgi:predicted acyltransferase